MADHELCLVVVRPVPDRGARLLAAFVAADGRLAWVRPAGPARTSAGDDLAPGRRRACLAEDRIVLVTHAGVIVAFDRDGAAAWTTTTPAAAATVAAETAAVRAASPLPATDVVFAGGRVVAAPRDAAGIVALDPWTGAIAWQWSPTDETVEQLLGACGDGVLVATAAGDGRARLRRLATADGREAATRAADPPDGPSRRRAGNGVVVDATVLWPLDGEGSSADAATTATVLEVLDGRSLERRREPLPLPFGEGGPVALGVDAGRDGGDSLACAAGTAIIRLAPGPRAAAAPRW
jgi:outer membrane protein assembly factor BamB